MKMRRYLPIVSVVLFTIGVVARDIPVSPRTRRGLAVVIDPGHSRFSRAGFRDVTVWHPVDGRRVIATVRIWYRVVIIGETLPIVYDSAAPEMVRYDDPSPLRFGPPALLALLAMIAVGLAVTRRPRRPTSTVDLLGDDPIVAAGGDDRAGTIRVDTSGPDR